MSEMLERRVLRDCYSMIYYQWRWSLTKKTDELSLSHKKFQCAFKSGGHDQRPSPPSTKNFVIRLLGSACVTGLALNTEMNDVSVADYSPSGGIYLVGCKDASHDHNDRKERITFLKDRVRCCRNKQRKASVLDR